MKKIALITLIASITFVFATEPKIAQVATKKTTGTTSKTQNSTIDNTVINGMNASLDKKFIEIKYLKKNPKTNVITTEIYLNGEKKNLGMNLKDFRWGYSQDDEFIILEKINVSFNIPWINYLINDSLKRDPYIVLPNYLSISDFLESIKPATNTTYNKPASQSFNPFVYMFNKKYFDIKTFDIKNKTIKGDIRLNGSDNLKFEITKFDLFTANKRKYIVLKNITLKSHSKPWLSYLIKSWDNSLKFDFDKDLYQTLGSGNYQYKSPISIEKPTKKMKENQQKKK